jgi:predicted PurR-regulated permease PerM
MSDSASTSDKGGFNQSAVNALRLGLLFLIVYWCYRIVAPFIPLVAWGVIIAVAIYPLYSNLAERLGNRIKLSATLVTLLGLLILTTPVVVLTGSLVESSTGLASDIAEGSVEVPPPPERVKEWPLVGEKLHSGWTQASRNLSVTLEKFSPQLELLRNRLIAIAGGAGGAFLQLFFSIIISGVFLAASKSSMAGARSLVNWLVGEEGPVLLHISETTIRSVARGVLGVAMIESILIAIGLVVAGVPAAGFWTFLVLVLSIIQIPPLLVLVPLTVYVLSASGPLGVTVFIICGVLAVVVDTLLKPVLLGRAADAPMLVVLMGAIGGMMLSGIVGLFVGAVVLTLGWELLQYSLKARDVSANEIPPPAQETAASSDQG